MSVSMEAPTRVGKAEKECCACNDVTGWDEIPMYEYVTSDGTVFSENDYDKYAYEEAVKHEIEWLNANV